MASVVAFPAKLAITPHLTEFTHLVARGRTPDEVLEALDVLAKKCLPPLSALGAARFPIQTSDWRSTRLGRDAFLHPSVPKGWWEEYSAMAQREHDPGVMMARLSLMACTLSETMKMLDPIGIDRWPYEVSLKYGIRDALTCSVGRRWLVCYWSPKVLSTILTQPMRITPNGTGQRVAYAVLDRHLIGPPVDAYAGDLPVQAPTKYELVINSRPRSHLALPFEPHYSPAPMR